LTDYIYENIENNKICIVLVLDLQKAFDSVSREIFIDKLSWCGLNCELAYSLINDRAQFVQIGNEKSCIENTTKGIQQGASTRSLFFSVYINDLPIIPSFYKPTLFADYTTLANSCKPKQIQQMVQNTEADLAKVQK